MRSWKKNCLGALAVITLISAVDAQPAERRYSTQEYIRKWKDVAIYHMHQHGIPASITLAQGILESDRGNSPLARYANNHFGIKCHKTWDGRTFKKDDDRKNECFRRYTDASGSYADHSQFLLNRSHYQELFTYKRTAYKKWARGLKKAGYATDPAYASSLIELIERYQLHRYDRPKKLASSEQEGIPNTEPEPAIDDTKKKNGSGADPQKERRIKNHENDIDYVVARRFDNIAAIAADLNMRESRIRKYNELDPDDAIDKGDIIFLQPKRNRARRDFHYVAKGETMYGIAQQYGIKLDKLYQKNCMEEGTEPEPGDKLFLRKGKRCSGQKAGLLQRLFGRNEK